jgi:hypothetical protein
MQINVPRIHLVKQSIITEANKSNNIELPVIIKQVQKDRGGLYELRRKDY